MKGIAVVEVGCKVACICVVTLGMLKQLEKVVYYKIYYEH